MSCPNDLEVSAYIDDMLESAERGRFLHHLGTCPVCKERVSAMQSLRSDLQALPMPVLGFDLAAQMEERTRSSRPLRRPAPDSRRGWFGWSAAGFAVALSLASGVWLGSLLIGSAAVTPVAGAARVFDPVPPGGLCAAAELCRVSRGMQ